MIKLMSRGDIKRINSTPRIEPSPHYIISVLNSTSWLNRSGIFGHKLRANSSMLRTGLHCSYSLLSFMVIKFLSETTFSTDSSIRSSARTLMPTHSLSHSLLLFLFLFLSHSLSRFRHQLFPTFFAMNSTILTVGTHET